MYCSTRTVYFDQSIFELNLILYTPQPPFHLEPLPPDFPVSPETWCVCLDPILPLPRRKSGR
jgi:hypothetical protein